MEYEHIADGLTAEGWAVQPEFLAPGEVRALSGVARALRGAFRPAGIGRGTARQTNPNIRSDLIHWLDEGPSPPEAVQTVLTRLEDLKTALNRRLFLGLREFEGHFAIYPPGAKYEKHVDNFRDASPRVLSCVLYLNDDWVEADAGKLRLYDRRDTGRVVTEVEPRGGTLAVFLSRETPHEVLPTAKERLSFTGWFRDR